METPARNLTHKSNKSNKHKFEKLVFEMPQTCLFILTIYFILC